MLFVALCTIERFSENEKIDYPFKEHEMKKMAVVLIALLVFFPFSFQRSVEAEKIDKDQERMEKELAIIQKDLVPPGTFIISDLSTDRFPKPSPMLLPNAKPDETKPKLIPIKPIEHIYKWLLKGK